MAPRNQCLFIIFALFVIFFTKPSPVLSHRCHPHESQALLSFKAALNDSYGDLSSWKNGSDCCTWDYISCDNHTNHVVTLSISANGSLAGMISDGLCNLTFLTNLDIMGVRSGTTTLPPCLGNLSLQYLRVSMIPSFICRLTSLTSLVLFPHELIGIISIPSCLANLSHLQSLRMGYLSGIIPSFICHLTSLTNLDLNGNELNGSIPPCLANLSSLESLDLSYNQLSGSIPVSLANLSLLSYLDMSSNQLTGNIPFSLSKLSSLHYLGLSSNQLSGSIPASLGKLSSVQIIDLSDNHLNGSIPASLGNLYSLKELHLSNNQLTGNIPVSLGNLSLLRYLNLSDNQLYGAIPSSFAQLSSLTGFYADGNAFNESISLSPFPSSIESLSFSLNHHQSISETIFHNLTKLRELYLSNCVLLNISTTWIPSFQLQGLKLVSCKIDGQIPPWISTQFSLWALTLVNNSLFGEIPSWLWAFPDLEHVDLSANHLQGNVAANSSIWPPALRELVLNDNLLSGNIPQSLGSLSGLLILNLANNNLTGIIPASLSKCSSLEVLNLANNSLEGSLPHEFSKLRYLYSLVVHNNKLRGPFPPSITNYSFLQIFDIGHNLFEGEIPTSVGNLSLLKVLVMKENNFRGTIPPNIGQLTSLQILLLSSNHISGFIPGSILHLQAMAIEDQDGFVLSVYVNASSGSAYKEELDMTSKGIDLHYKYILSTLTSIDLSNNELEGEVPNDLGILKGLRLLNLSMNNFNGTIPKSLVNMSQLESLDLSKNRFSGKILDELKSMDSLGFLNLSNNNLSGRIPHGGHADTFEKSSYLGNPNLWGCPLPKKCSLPKFAPPPPVSINKEKQSTDYPWYEISVGLSYGAGFGVIIAFIVIKMSWKKRYFKKVDDILKFMFPWLKNWTL